MPEALVQAARDYGIGVTRIEGTLDGYFRTENTAKLFSAIATARAKSRRGRFLVHCARGMVATGVMAAIYIVGSCDPAGVDFEKIGRFYEIDISGRLREHAPRLRQLYLDIVESSRVSVVHPDSVGQAIWRHLTMEVRFTGPGRAALKRT